MDDRAIKVYVRFRGQNAEEISQGGTNTIQDISTDKKLLKYNLCERHIQPDSRTVNFKFDHIFGPTSTNDMLYSEIGPSLFDSVYNGYNTSIIFHGEQMNLWNDKKCIAAHFIINTLGKLSSVIQRNDDKNISYKLSISYIAVFMERVFDLFNPERYDDNDNGEVRNITDSFLDTITKNDIDINKGCTESTMMNILVETAKHFKHYITDSNKCHTLFVINLIQYNTKTRITLKSRIKFWKIKKYAKIKKTRATEQALRNAQRNNQSVSAFDNIISELSMRKSNVCYEDSSLTALLMEDLGGNCNTHFMFNCGCSSENDSVLHDHEMRTISYLRKAFRMRKIINCPIIGKSM